MRPGKPMERTPRAVHRPSTALMAARRLATAGLLGWWVLAASGAWAEAPHETVMKAQVGSGLLASSIVVTVFRPAGDGPFPLVVLSHGSPRTPAERDKPARMRFPTQSERFVRMGYAVVVPTRRGYGESGGPWVEGYGHCSNPDYYAAGLETARDIEAAIESVRHEPWADARRIVLVGVSAGGFGSVAAASKKLPGVVAVVNFAGGRGSQATDRVCGEPRLVEAMGRYAAAGVPELWLYSVNDRFFGPELAHRMHAAFVQAGGRAEFVAARAVGLDGHGYFVRDVEDWEPRVRRFLSEAGALP